MSVFWRHRTEEVIHAGRLSDIYLLTAGYWKHFSVNSWIEFTQKIWLTSTTEICIGTIVDA